MQKDDGFFRNFLSFNREFMEDTGSEDAFGRTIWALGYTMRYAPGDSYHQIVRSMFYKASANFQKIKSIRSVAYIMIGLSYYLQSNGSDDCMIEEFRQLTYDLIAHYESHTSENWNWFEDSLTYDNAMLPLALMHAAQVFNDDKIRHVALQTMNFLIKHTFSGDYLSTVGNDGWFRKGGDKARFAQQPIDTLAAVLMFHQAYYLTNDKAYLKKLLTSYKWFFGENELRIRLYDFETCGCCDGLEHYGVNRNQGAESTLAYLISHLTVVKAHEEFCKVI